MKKGIILIMFLLILPLCFAEWSQLHNSPANSDKISYSLGVSNYSTILQTIAVSDGRSVPISKDIDGDGNDDLIFYDSSLLNLYLYSPSQLQYVLSGQYFIEGVTASPYLKSSTYGGSNELFLQTNLTLYKFSVSSTGFTLAAQTDFPLPSNLHSTSQLPYGSMNCFTDTCFVQGDGVNYFIYNITSNSFTNFSHPEMWSINNFKSALFGIVNDDYFVANCKNGTKYGMALFSLNGSFFRSNCSISPSEISGVPKVYSISGGIQKILFSDIAGRIYLISQNLKADAGFPISLSNVQGFGYDGSDIKVCYSSGGALLFERYNLTGGKEMGISTQGGTAAYFSDGLVMGTDFDICQGQLVQNWNNSFSDLRNANVPNFPVMLSVGANQNLLLSNSTEFKIYAQNLPYPLSTIIIKSNQTQIYLNANFTVSGSGSIWFIGQQLAEVGGVYVGQNIPAGNYNITIFSSGYLPSTQAFSILNGQRDYTFYLNQNSSSTVSFKANFLDDSDLTKITSNVTAYIDWYNSSLGWNCFNLNMCGVLTLNGSVDFGALPRGNYSIHAYAEGYNALQTINFVLETNLEKDFLLKKIPFFTNAQPYVTNVNYYVPVKVINYSLVPEGVLNFMTTNNITQFVNQTTYYTYIQYYSLLNPIEVCQGENLYINFTLYKGDDEPFNYQIIYSSLEPIGSTTSNGNNIVARNPLIIERLAPNLALSNLSNILVWANSQSNPKTFLDAFNGGRTRTSQNFSIINCTGTYNFENGRRVMTFDRTQEVVKQNNQHFYSGWSKSTKQLVGIIGWILISLIVGWLAGVPFSQANDMALVFMAGAGIGAIAGVIIFTAIYPFLSPFTAFSFVIVAVILLAISITRMVSGGGGPN